MGTRVGFCASFLFALLFVSSAAAAPLALQVDSKTITVFNVPGGGAVVLFSCSRVPRPRSIEVSPQVLTLRDDDHDGMIRLTPQGGVPLRSVWIAVDVASGQYAAAAQQEFPLIVAPLAAEALRKDAEDELESVAVDMPSLLMMVVRPGVGAWQLKGFDGSPRDRDGVADGRVRFAFEDAQPVENKVKSPKHLRNGDLVVAIDPGHLDVFVTRIGR